MNKTTSRIMFNLPKTPKCRVEYVNGNIRYSKIMPTPRTNDALQVALLAHKIGMSQVKAVVAI
jgi:hypothetical protein